MGGTLRVERQEALILIARHIGGQVTLPFMKQTPEAWHNQLPVGVETYPHSIALWW